MRLRHAIVVLLMLATGCRPTADPNLVPPTTTSSNAAQPGLFENASFTAAPRAVFHPQDVATPPAYQAESLALNPREQFEGWVRDLDNGSLQFGVSIHEADGLYPSLEGATVADIGAGYGNNLKAWMSLLGPRGRLVETEVDVNAARFMAYAAHKLGYASRTLVIESEFADPCLPVGQFDLILCSQLHSHITISHVVDGPYPANEETLRIFRQQSRKFLSALRRALKDDKSLLIVIEGFQNRSDYDPHQIYLGEAEALANIEANGFKLISKRENDHVWVASFVRAVK